MFLFLMVSLPVFCFGRFNVYARFVLVVSFRLFQVLVQTVLDFRRRIAWQLYKEVGTEVA